jgi:hypothetical protein
MHADGSTAERWRPVVGWEGLYEVSDQGRVRSLRAGRLLTLCVGSSGYQQVGLSRSGRVSTQAVHRLVAAAFLGPRPKGAVTLHGPAGRLDNRVCNLSYGTTAKNQGPDRLRDGTLPRGTRNGRAKLTKDDVRAIRGASAAGASQRKLARLHGVSHAVIGRIVRRESWAWLDEGAA